MKAKSNENLNRRLQRDEDRLHAEWISGPDATLDLDTLASDKKVGVSISIKKKNNLNCPLCLDRVETEVIMCVKCNTLLHYDCVSELNNGNCPVLGCKTYLGSEKNIPQASKETAEDIIRRITRRDLA